MVSTASSGNMSEAEIDALSRQKSYLRVYALLIRSAEERTTVTYGEVAAILALPPSGQHMARETGRMLGAITHREHACGRPMLTAVVVSSSDERARSWLLRLSEADGPPRQRDDTRWGAPVLEGGTGARVRGVE